MATYTLEELYLGERYNILGKACAEFLAHGSPDVDEQTGVELLIVKHSILTTIQLLTNGDFVSDFESEMKSPFLFGGDNNESD